MFPTAHGVVSQGRVGGPPAPTGITYIAADANTHSGASSTILPIPDGAEPGDILVAALAQNSPSGTPTDTDGWTIIHTALNPNSDRPTWLAYIVLPPTPPASYTWTFSTSTNRAVSVAAFRGQSASTPILAEAWNQGTAAPPALTAATGAAAFGAWRRVTTTGALDAPGAMTELTNEYGSGSNVALTTAYETSLAAGSYSRSANATLSNLNASVVLIQP